jgi:hypothetical protein
MLVYPILLLLVKFFRWITISWFVFHIKVFHMKNLVPIYYDCLLSLLIGLSYFYWHKEEKKTIRTWKLWIWLYWWLFPTKHAHMYDQVTIQLETHTIRNPKWCNSTGQALGLLPKSHQFESHKLQGFWRLPWSLTSRPMILVEVRTS